MHAKSSIALTVQSLPSYELTCWSSWLLKRARRQTRSRSTYAIRPPIFCQRSVRSGHWPAALRYVLGTNVHYSRRNINLKLLQNLCVDFGAVGAEPYCKRLETYGSLRVLNFRTLELYFSFHVFELCSKVMNSPKYEGIMVMLKLVAFLD